MVLPPAAIHRCALKENRALVSYIGFRRAALNEVTVRWHTARGARPIA